MWHMMHVMHMMRFLSMRCIKVHLSSILAANCDAYKLMAQAAAASVKLLCSEPSLSSIHIHALSAGTGYKGRARASLMPLAPKTDGLWLIDMISGKTKLLLSLESLLPQDATALHKTTQTHTCFTWFSKPQVEYSYFPLVSSCFCHLTSSPHNVRATASFWAGGRWLD